MLDVSVKIWSIDRNSFDNVAFLNVVGTEGLIPGLRKSSVFLSKHQRFLGR
jgi:hypothetical protein